jgi:hypothetical protein
MKDQLAIKILITRNDSNGCYGKTPTADPPVLTAMEVGFVNAKRQRSKWNQHLDSLEEILVLGSHPIGTWVEGSEQYQYLDTTMRWIDCSIGTYNNDIKDRNCKRIVFKPAKES